MDIFGMLQMYDGNLNLQIEFQPHGWNIINQFKQLSNGYVATCSSDKTVKIWDPSSSPWKLLRNYTGHTDSVQSLEVISTDLIASGSKDKTIKIWSVNTGELQKTIQTPSSVIRLKLLSNGLYLVAILNPNILNIYNISTSGNVNFIMTGHNGTVLELELIGDSNLLASSSDDLTIRIWDLTSLTCKFILTGHTDAVYGLKSISNEVLASASQDNTINLWNITNGDLIRTLTGHTNPILWSIDKLKSEEILFSGSIDQNILMWNLTTGEVMKAKNTGLSIHSLVVYKTITSKYRIFHVYISFGLRKIKFRKIN
jgi:WD40 repeat protein